ncbi:DUF2845 domain-containing protein [Undibacterium flavidum]|uniref:DUF2845 domain-containing protein n=1 Tax=Undibacterium flavidum TaxID=2762297 RepID=A0ABR6Y8S9_9BURK|nr:DUF2845 domain-containing protein [Undibacterium flavidum]MBC3872991.1 DUF2845 domain-containing protein [Undibacterium flavidum]
MKRHLPVALLSVLIAGFGISNAAQALAFRCNTYVIDVGMHKAEIIQKCGNPMTRDQRIERRRLGVRQSNSNLQPAPATPPQVTRNGVDYEREVEIQIEEWVYNFGPQRFMQLLVFEDGRLKSIQDLSYGQ